MLSPDALKPKAEPEVEDLKRWPKRGSLAWKARYNETLDHLDKMVVACPSANERVLLAFVELTEAIRQDFFSAKEDGHA